MTKFCFSLSRFPIKYQILIGFIPVFIILLILAVNSLRYFSKADAALVKLTVMQREAMAFGDIKKDLISLQRNVMVYSYIGYSGVLKKISFTQNILEENFKKIDFYAKESEQIKTVFSGMYENYTHYNKHFKQAINEKDKLAKLYANQLESISTITQSHFNNIQLSIKQNKNYKLLYFIEKINLDLFIVKNNLYSFEHKPDSKLIIDNRKRFKRIHTYLLDIANQSKDKALQADIEQFLNDIQTYNAINKSIIRTSQSYTRLVNVVMAGKSSEIQSLIEALNILLYNETNILKNKVKKDVARSRFHFIILLVIALIIGLLTPFFVARSIANPVMQMANILQTLSKGNIDMEIPALNRKDEVGEMAKAANAFKITAQELKHQTAELEEFAYRTSHDLRSPLVSSITLLGIVKKSIRKQAYERVESSVDLVTESLIKLETLVKDILDLTKTKNAVEQEKPFNIAAAIDNSLNKISHMSGFERLSINKTINVDSDIFIKVSRITLIIENLLSNAVKYQDPKTPNPYIHIDCYIHEGQLILSIEDNGLGIPKAYQDQLFSMFKRFHPKVSFGSGLGLYMLKKSADVLQGNIHFVDTGNGAKFVLSIPYSQPHL